MMDEGKRNRRSLCAASVAWLCQEQTTETNLRSNDVTGLTRLESGLQELVLEVAETVGYQVDDIMWVVHGLEIWKMALKVHLNVLFPRPEGNIR